MEKLAFLLQLQWPAILCMVGGLALVVIEMFIPGFGAPGLCGIALLIAGVVLGAADLFQAMVLILILLVILVACFAIVLRSASKGRISRSPLVLQNSARKEDGYISNEDMSYFVGKNGKAVSALHPAGVAEFEGVRLDVVTEGGFIEAGSPVTVFRVEGPRIIVKTGAGEGSGKSGEA